MIQNEERIVENHDIIIIIIITCVTVLLRNFCQSFYDNSSTSYGINNERNAYFAFFVSEYIPGILKIVNCRFTSQNATESKLLFPYVQFSIVTNRYKAVNTACV